jgi:hypothetical protein
MISVVKQIVSIKEGDKFPVEGEIRPPVFPLDYFQIENKVYQIRSLHKLENNNFSFGASVVSR